MLLAWTSECVAHHAQQHGEQLGELGEYESEQPVHVEAKEVLLLAVVVQEREHVLVLLRQE
jgi:hypothetical protein